MWISDIQLLASLVKKVAIAAPFVYVGVSPSVTPEIRNIGLRSLTFGPSVSEAKIEI